MKTNKHTAGPWVLIDGFPGVSYVQDERGHDVARTFSAAQPPREGRVGPTITYVEAEANARLIAAAPEMFEALKLAYDSACTNQDSAPSKEAFLKMKAAIIKAVGNV